MSNWREQILDDIKNREEIIIIIDPNHIVSSNEQILKQIDGLGFEIISDSNSISLRYFIESKNRESDSGKFLILYFNDKFNAQREIPYDILQINYENGGFVEATVEEIFPLLSPNIVSQLNSKYYDELYSACNELKNSKNEIETKEFILQKIFEISSEIFVNKISFFISELIKLHYSSKQLPKILSKYIEEKAKKNIIFENWDLDRLILDKRYFFEFLQNQWESTVKNNSAKIPFQDNDIFLYLDNLFLEGYLQQIEVVPENLPEWMKIGIKDFDKKQKLFKFNEHAKLVQKELSPINDDSNYDEWIKFSLDWAYLLSKSFDFPENPILKQIYKEIQTKFPSWIDKKYKLLRTLTSSKPVMVHHILPYLLNERRISSKKIALIVLDGLSLSQWYLIRNKILSKKINVKEKTEAIFAWIPTITSISRQAIFSGETPFYFKDSLLDTRYEEKFWKNKWTNEFNLKSNEIFYSTGNRLWELSIGEEIPIDSIQILGFVINTVDEKMHDATGGMKDLVSQINSWIDKGMFLDFIKLLLDKNFEIIITSDHGNTEARGIGEPKDFSKERGRRVRIYTDKNSLINTAEKFSQSKIWWPKMAGEKYHFLLAKENNAFSRENQTIVTHGGDSLDEVIVPFVKLWRD